LILQGGQGQGKSSFFDTLFGEWFDDSMGCDIANKDNQMILHRCWCQEWGELEYITGNRHAAEVKRFLSRRRDTFRVPYGARTEDFPRRGIIVGSTNKTEFLNDPTGNRRFWVVPVQVNKIDLQQLKQERDRIWAAAVQAYRTGETWHLTWAEEQTLRAIADSFRTEDPWTERVAEFLKGLEYVTTHEILVGAFGLSLDKIGRSEQMRIADILTLLGWSQKGWQVEGIW
jgi:predicted P-loop ATPase